MPTSPEAASGRPEGPRPSRGAHAHAHAGGGGSADIGLVVSVDAVALESNASNVRFEGIDVRHAQGNGMVLRGSNVTVDNCSSSHHGAVGVVMCVVGGRAMACPARTPRAAPPSLRARPLACAALCMVSGRWARPPGTCRPAQRPGESQLC